MATPSQVQQAVVDDLSANLAGLSTCAVYAGEFSGEEIPRSSLKCPAVLIACLGGTRKDEVDTGEVDWLFRFTAYCLTRHAGGREQRGALALMLAESVLQKIDGSRFGLTGVYPAGAKSVDNMYAAIFDKAGMGAWAVTWEQTLRIGTDEWAALPDYSIGAVYLGLAPEIGIPHEEDYIRVVPGGEK